MFHKFKKIFIHDFDDINQLHKILMKFDQKKIIVYYLNNGKHVNLSNLLSIMGIDSIQIRSDDKHLTNKILMACVPDLLLTTFHYTKSSFISDKILAKYHINIYIIDTSLLKCIKCDKSKYRNLNDQIISCKIYTNIQNDNCQQLKNMISEYTTPEIENRQIDFLPSNIPLIHDKNKKKDKFQKLMSIEAKRHQYLCNREEYKKNIHKISSTK